MADNHNDDDDFQPMPERFQDILSSALADVGTLRNFTRPAKRSRLAKQKPGPKPKVVRLKFFLLPDGCDLPKISKADPAVERLQALGYGFPSSYYEDGKGKAHTVPLILPDADFKENIRSLYTKLTGKDFILFTNTQSRNLVEAPFNVQYFKTLRYQGIVVIKIQDQPSGNSPIQQERRVGNENQVLPPDETPVAPPRPVLTTTAPVVIPSTTPQVATPRRFPSQTSTSNDQTPQSAGWIPAGTPDITINPRHQLMMQQELDLAVSLAADQEKENARHTARVRRNLARTERRRQRELRKEQAERIHTDAIQEIASARTNTPQEDMITVVLVLPDQKELNKSFSKNTISETLHLYVEAVTDVVMAKLVYCGQVVQRVQETISSLGISGNCRIIVEEADIEDSSDESETEEHQPLEPTELLRIKDVADLERRRVTVLEGLLPSADIKISRENIIDDVFSVYRDQPDIIHHRLNVSFEGEENAVDLDGVTREMFSCFFLAIFVKFFAGRTHKLPLVDTRTLFNDTLILIGKIISHAFVLCNYLPPALSPVVYILVGSGCCSDDLVLSSFLSYIPETDHQLVCTLLSQNFTELRAELVNFISTYGGYEIPQPANIRQAIIDIAKLNMTVIPFVPIARIKMGMDCYPLLWQGASESLILNIMDKFKPTAQKVVDLLSYSASDNPTLLMLEERVKTYLERYIRSLSDQQLLAFLRFWTSSDTLCFSKLNVTFNSNEGISRRPIANTCDAVLHVSRMYFSVDEFMQDFNVYLNDDSARVFDSI